MKQIEHDINQQVDIKELKRIGSQYANSGNYTIALKAWLKAVALGDTECRSSIIHLVFSKNTSDKEELRKAIQLIKQWRDEGDETINDAIGFQMKLRTIINQ